MNIEEVKKHINYLSNDKYHKEFFVAILLYDIAGLNEMDITEEDVNKAYEIYKKHDSVYKEEVQKETREELEREYQEQESEYEASIY